MGANAGGIWYVDGESWKQMTTGTNETKTSTIWGCGPDHVYAGGKAGILRYNGSTWSAAFDLGEPITSIRGTACNDFYALGYDSLFHFDGQKWDSVTDETISRTSTFWAFDSRDIYLQGGCRTYHSVCPDP
ncbi:MAG: hypothetical protein GY854_18885 [Deltaproteobacteria bacterium]|nr:hypothetical protein [Deltaproteobacteria bacterium]